jgi:hypothetical protein
MVWLSFFTAMTFGIGLFAFGGNELSGGYLAASAQPIGRQAEADPIFHTQKPIEQRRWKGIVIHDLGQPVGDAESVHRLHLSYGYQGLGYHFLIGNGNGLGDGIIHVGYRWDRQLPGAHVAGPAGTEHNQHSIGICLVGSGDRRAFTENQVQSLISLVRRLQQELDIPAEGVHLHRDLAPTLASPGRFFPAALLREQLLD